MRTIILAAVLAAIAVSSPQAVSAAPPAKLTVCVACHGADGVGKSPQYPNLRGQKVKYIEKQLKAFRGGDRKDPFMSVMAKPLTDEDIVALAGYFSSLK